MIPATAPRSAALVAAGAFLAFLAGCSGGGFGDPPSKPLGDEYGNGERLCSLLGPATWLDPMNTSDPSKCKPPPDHAVYSTGLVVVAIDSYDETGKGAIGNYYVQDPECAGKPYAGATVFDPTFSPPDLRVAVNDVVDVNGTISEFLGPSSGSFGQCRTLPEISGTLSFRFDGATPPEPVVIDVLDLKDYQKARQWLGMLVTVKNITLADNPTASGGRYSVPIDTGGGAVADRPKITNELYDLAGQGPMLADTMTFKSVTGVVTYFYGFHLAPRSPADFVQ